MFCFILVCIVILYLVYCLYIYSLYRKPTTIETLLNYDVNIDTTPVSIVTESDKYKNIYANSIPFVKFDTTLTDTSSYVTDTYTYAISNVKTDLKVQTVLDDQKVFLLIKKRDAYSYETLDDMIRNHRIIGYPSQIHKKIFEFICKANEVDISSIKMKESSSLDEVDVLLFFDSLSNIKKITESYKNINIDFITYDGYNIHLLKFYLPYCKIKGINLTDFPGYLDRFPVKTCIVFDMILAGVKYIPEIGVPLIAESNYMTLYFEFLPESLSVLGRSNQHIIDRSSKQILEQFATAEGAASTEAKAGAEPITIEPKHAINGYLMDGKFYHDMTHIDGIPLINGMKIILKQQWNDTENGKYITSDNPMIFIKDVGEAGSVIREVIREVGECIDHPNIKTESTCPTTWDKRCDINEDCPFYQANKKYPNYFGGCESGYCQMPLGIKRTGYRKYDENSKPLCHDTIGDIRGECNNKNPDYAFELDQFQRLSTNIHTNFHK